MTFPDRKYPSVAGFTDDYFQRLRDAHASIDRKKLAAAAQLLEKAYAREATLYVCGNGGSAAIADSFVCDHAKLIQTDTSLVPKVVSLSANVPMVTAIANDISYADIFVYQLRTMARAGDVLLTVSASGDSENVVRAAKWARKNGVAVISFTGFAGGRTARLATVHLHVTGDNYGVIEDAHQSLMHILAQYIRQARMSESLIKKRKF
ncbi:MAG: SIS domain-containing protein [Rhodospirillales bacterium]|nr:SIS domain-containing protein [Rhodospirillales bacterium]